MPFVYGDLAGDDCRLAAVALFEDFEEVVMSGGVEGCEAPIVEDEQLTLPSARSRRAYRPSLRASARSEKSLGMRW
jgi:hypothetical protein